MARTVYSEHLYSAVGLNGSASRSVPAGFRLVLRDVDVYNGAGGTATFFLKGGLGQVIWAHRWALGDGASSEQWRGRQVLDEGFSWSVSTTLPMDVTVSGYLLSLP